MAQVPGFSLELFVKGKRKMERKEEKRKKEENKSNRKKLKTNVTVYNLRKFCIEKWLNNTFAKSFK